MIKRKTVQIRHRILWTDSIKDWAVIQNIGELVTVGRNRQNWLEIVCNLEHPDAT